MFIFEAWQTVIQFVDINQKINSYCGLGRYKDKKMNRGLV
ncbi:hypothetical protein KKH3_42520 [Pectobacterium actinidiae]|nr:hypothetical protein KKH3_42520 [Pectobacterium actinidiae]